MHIEDQQFLIIYSFSAHDNLQLTDFLPLTGSLPLVMEGR